MNSPRVNQIQSVMQHLVCPLPADFDPNNGDYLFYAGNNKGAKEINFKLVGDVTVRKTELEKKTHRQSYRKLYSRRPHVQLKARLRLADPEKAAKRKEYANLPKVKKRKQELAALGRAVRRKMKETHPQLYSQLVDDITSVKLDPLEFKEEVTWNDDGTYEKREFQNYPKGEICGSS